MNGFRYKLQIELMIETPAISPSVKLLVNINKERGVKKYLLDNLLRYLKSKAKLHFTSPISTHSEMFECMSEMKV